MTIEEPEKRGRGLRILGIMILVYAACNVIGPALTYGEEAETAALKEEIKLYVGETRIIPSTRPSRVAVGNPKVADIADITEDIIVLSPLAEGTTTLTFWDNAGQHVYSLRVVAEGMLELKTRIDDILKELDVAGVQSKILEAEGKIFLLGEVKSSQEKSNIDLALGVLKKKVVNLIKVRPEDIVEIEAQIVELDKDGTKALGFTWPNTIELTERGSPGIPTAEGGVLGTKWSTLFKVLNLSRDRFIWTLSALVQEGKANILSKPKLVCLSGKEAELLVGGEKPIFTTQVVGGTGGTGTTVEYKEFGVKLKIKPTVDKNRINLGLNIEVSEIGEADIIGNSSAPTAKAYPLSKRTVSTEVSLEDNQTLGIGGLIKQNKKEEIIKTPFLSDIPILGVFFKKRTVKRGGGFGEGGDTELFIVLTPKIVTAQKQGVEKETSSEAQPASVAANESASAAAESAAVSDASGTQPTSAPAHESTAVAEIPSAGETTSTQSSSSEQQQPESSTAAVLIAKREILPETPIVAEDIEIKQVPVEDIQPGAVKSLEEVIGEKVSNRLFPGEQILKTTLFPSEKTAAASRGEGTSVAASTVPSESTPLSDEQISSSSLQVCCPDDAKTASLTQTGVSTNGDTEASATVTYINTVRNAILETLTYPAAAQKSGYEGRVKLRLHIASTGELLGVTVKDSSSYELLDNNALSAARNIPTYPPFPSAISLKDLWLDVPIDYQLN